MDVKEVLEGNYNTLINSYNTFKTILEPNLTDEKKKLMNFIVDLLISQIKLFIDLNSTTNYEKVYQILNLNNQDLSQRISCLFHLIEKNDNFSNAESIIEESKNSRNKKFDNLTIISSNNINIKKNNLFSNNRETIRKTNNTIYDVDEDNFSASEKNENSELKNPNKNNDLIKINQKKYDSKNKNNYIINNSSGNKNPKKLNSYNNRYDDKKKDLSYNLNINIYSNNSNNNLRNQTEQNYNNYNNLNNKYYHTNAKYKNLDDNSYYKQSNDKRKIDNYLNKNKNQIIPKKIEVVMKNNGKDNDLNKEKKTNNKLNINSLPTKVSLKSLDINNFSKNKINRNNRELMKVCENDINSYRE